MNNITYNKIEYIINGILNNDKELKEKFKTKFNVKERIYYNYSNSAYFILIHSYINKTYYYNKIKESNNKLLQNKIKTIELTNNE